MRKMFLLVTCLLATITVMAGSVTPGQAEQYARQFLTKHRTMSATQPLQMAHHRALPRRAASQAAYYVFNVGSDNGYVIVSGDDRTPQILGYGTRGSFEPASIPDNMRAMLQSYADQIEWLTNHAATPLAPKAEHAAIAPLLTTTWDQGEPYNNQCPMDGSKRSVTGCVATAMAQVINFHKYPAKTLAPIPAYTTRTNGQEISQIAVTTLDWDNMLDSYSGSGTEAQRKAVAQLMLLCGASVKMDYTYKESGAFTEEVPNALKTYFGYDANTTYANRNDYRASEWDALIYQELEGNRPVLYGGQSTGGGHAFVIDGYDSDGLYHVNWGWGGMCDDYFLLSILDPDSNNGIGASSSTDGYSYGQDAVIGAQPNTDVEPQAEAMMQIYDIHTDQTTVSLENNVFKVSLTSSIYNISDQTYDFDFGIGVFNAAHELVYAESQWSYEGLPAGYGFSEVPFSVSVPSSLGDGLYTIRCLFRESGSSEWRQAKNSDRNSLTAAISGSVMALINPTVNLKATISVSNPLETNRLVTTTTTVTNQGTFFNETLMLRVDGQDVGGQHIDLDTGDTKTVQMTFTPAKARDYELEVGYYTDYYDNDKEEWQRDFHLIAEQTISVVLGDITAPIITGTMAITNSNEDGNVEDTTVQVNASFTNSGLSVDWLYMAVNLYKLDAEKGSYQWLTNKYNGKTSKQGVTATFDFTFDGLELGSYLLTMSYYYEEEWYNLDSPQVAFEVVTPTGVTARTANSESVMVYSIDGRQIGHLSADALRLLPKGVYVINGRKVCR